MIQSCKALIWLGYKLRTSIGKAMKTRSKAIRTALKKYNSLAPQMDPPAPVLQWKDVMNYAFVSEFDLLHHAYSHKDITQLPWALQINREIAAKYYKIKGARDEIVRLNIECRRLHTHIRDEEAHYVQVIHELSATSPLLASEVRRSYENRRRVNRIHRVRLNAIQSLDGFTGWFTPGVRSDEQAARVDHREDDEPANPPDSSGDGIGPGAQIARGRTEPIHGVGDGSEHVLDEEAERAAVQADMAREDDAQEVADDERLNEEMEVINDFVEQLAVEPVPMRRGVRDSCLLLIMVTVTRGRSSRRAASGGDGNLSPRLGNNYTAGCERTSCASQRRVRITLTSVLA